MHLRRRSEYVIIKIINVIPSYFIVVGLTYMVDNEHKLTYVQSGKEQDIVQKLIRRPQGRLCTLRGGLNMLLKRKTKKTHFDPYSCWTNICGR